MQLLMVCDRFPPDPGGQAASAERISGTLARMGHAVEVLTLSNREAPGRARSTLSAHCLAVHRFGPFDDAALTLQQAEHLALLLHRRHRFEATWAHGLGTAGFLATIFARRAGVPLVLAARGDDLDRLFYPPGDFARMEWCFRSAAAISAVSADLAERIEAVCGRSVIVLPNAVDGEKFRPGPRPEGLALRYGVRSDELVLGFSGELRASKGISHLLEVFRLVRTARPATRLLLIGDVHPDDRSELQRFLAGAPGLATGIVRTGHVRDPGAVARHLRLCDVLLLPSLREGLPNSLLEGLASGILVVASAVGGVPEVIVDGRNGVLVPRTHLHLFGRRVLEVLDWPADRRRKVIEAGRTTVLERYTISQERARLAVLLEQLSSPVLASRGINSSLPCSPAENIGRSRSHPR
jgi:glycosyltransferase involved in cell wall biosynthesis